ncbi:hypothetical protein HDR63_02420 [bacterium]|nr:hypothetical protein [bacterium]
MITKTESIQIQGHDATKTIVTDDAGRIIRKSWTINEFDGFDNFLCKETRIQYLDDGKRKITLYKRALESESIPYWTEITRQPNGDCEELCFKGKDKKQYRTFRRFCAGGYMYTFDDAGGKITEEIFSQETGKQVSYDHRYPHKVTYDPSFPHKDRRCVIKWTDDGEMYYKVDHDGETTEVFRKNVDTGWYTKEENCFGCQKSWTYDENNVLQEYKLSTIFSNNSHEEKYEYYDDHKTLKTKTIHTYANNLTIRETYDQAGNIIERYDVTRNLCTKYSESNGIKRELTTKNGKFVKKVLTTDDRKYTQTLLDDGTLEKEFRGPKHLLILKSRHGRIVYLLKEYRGTKRQEKKVFDDNGVLLEANESYYGPLSEETKDDRRNSSSYKKVFDGDTFRIETKKYDADTRTETRTILNTRGIEVSKTIREFDSDYIYYQPILRLREYDHSVLVQDTKYKVNSCNKSEMTDDCRFDPKTGALVKHVYHDAFGNEVTVTWDAQNNCFQKTVRHGGEIVYQGADTQDLVLDRQNDILTLNGTPNVYDVQSKLEGTFLRVNGTQRNLYLGPDMKTELFAESDGKRCFHFSDAIKCYIFGRHCDKQGDDLSELGRQQAKNIGILLGLMLMGRLDMANIVRPDEILCTNNPRSIHTANIIADNIVKTAGIDLPDVKTYDAMLSGHAAVKERNANLLTISSCGNGFVGDAQMGSINIAPKIGDEVYQYQGMLTLDANRIQSILAEYGIHQK